MPVEGGCMRIVQTIVLQMIKGMTVLARYVWTFLWPKLCQVLFHDSEETLLKLPFQL